jgi:hypothetical protein
MIAFTTDILISTLSADGVELSVNNGKLKIDAPRGVLSAEDKELLRVHKAEIIRKLSQTAEKPKVVATKTTIQQRINNFIARGISFAVNADNFEIAKGAENLTKKDTDYLVSNAEGVLCHLQQMLLCKEIFDHEPALLEDFKTEVTEREGIVADGNQTLPREVREEIVMEVIKIWYADIFKEEL